jgi:tRNA U34 5-methylaminomethyl-2-thiouridine-forming methyltransferase MnmC
VSDAAYELVRLAGGGVSVRSRAEGETFHPVIGPAAEAEALYVRQLGLDGRLAAVGPRPLVVWDVGLGSGANVAVTLRLLGARTGRLHVVSFDRTLEPLLFARRHAAELGYPLGLEGPEDALVSAGCARFRQGLLEVQWEVHVGDFPELIAGDTPLPAPDAIFHDAYSPARNPAMWTLPLFAGMRARLDPARPCSLATYSRATLVRTTLLCAGFHVGAGEATGEKEETTVAASHPELIDRPLDAAWLERAGRSTSAEPLTSPAYRQAPLSPERLARLRTHPQFACLAEPGDQKPTRS